MTNDPAPKVTVVFVTRDRRAELLHSLAKVTALPERPPVIVVDNGSSDGSPSAVRPTFPAVRVFELPRNLGSAGRNVGVLASQTPYVAFCDDDSWWAPGALAKAAAVLDQHPDVGLVAARILVGPEDRLDPISAEMAASPLHAEPGAPGPAVLGFMACGAVVRRRAYLAVKGFHPRFGVGGEEAMVALDLAAGGWQLVYRDDVVAHHHPSLTRNPEQRERRMTRNDLWTAWLRLPLRTALAITARTARGGLRRAPVRHGLFEALGALPSMWPERHVVPPPVARAHALLSSR